MPGLARQGVLERLVENRQHSSLERFAHDSAKRAGVMARFVAMGAPCTIAPAQPVVRHAMQHAVIFKGPREMARS